MNSKGVTAIDPDTLVSGESSAALPLCDRIIYLFIFFIVTCMKDHVKVLINSFIWVGGITKFHRVKIALEADSSWK